MSDAQTKLGLSCPKEGSFYICDNADIRFVGCCTVDPCTKERGGVCPTDDVRPASFSSDAYNQIGQQSCFSPESDDIWYTCKAMADNPTPFMGCCKSNPCSADGCATKDLFPARLSDNPDKAQIFLASGSTSTPEPDASESSFPKGAIIGIAIGAASLVCILIAILMYRRRYVAKKRKSEKEAEEAAKLYNPGYQGRKFGFISIAVEGHVENGITNRCAQSIHRATRQVSRQVSLATGRAASQARQEWATGPITARHIMTTTSHRQHRIGTPIRDMSQSCPACRGTQSPRTCTTTNITPNYRKNPT